MSEDLSSWLAAAGRVPLLTAAEELHLGAMVRRWLDDPDPSPAMIRRGRRCQVRQISGWPGPGGADRLTGRHPVADLTQISRAAPQARAPA